MNRRKFSGTIKKTPQSGWPWVVIVGGNAIKSQCQSMKVIHLSVLTTLATPNSANQRDALPQTNSRHCGRTSAG